MASLRESLVFHVSLRFLLIYSPPLPFHLYWQIFFRFHRFICSQQISESPLQLSSPFLSTCSTSSTSSREGSSRLERWSQKIVSRQDSSQVSSFLSLSYFMDGRPERASIGLSQSSAARSTSREYPKLGLSSLLARSQILTRLFCFSILSNHYSGLFLLFQSILTYLPMSYQRYAASILAGNDFFRSTIAASFPLFGEQYYSKLGIGKGNTILAAITALMIPILWLLKKKGAYLRARSKYATN